MPHGHTQIEAGDKCLLIGDPDILQGIADYFQRGSSEFPLQFGTSYCLLDDGLGPLPNFDECRWLLENTEAKGFGILYQGKVPSPTLAENLEGKILGDRSLSRSLKNLVAVTDELDCAMLILPDAGGTWKDKLWWGHKGIFAILDRTPEPVLLSRGSHPYKKILVAVSPSKGSLRAAELAVDVARMLGAELTVIGVQPPDFVVGGEYKDLLLQTIESIRAKAQLYSRRVETILVEGNPVTQVLKICEEFDLLVVAHRRFRSFSMTRADVSRHLVMKAPGSVMVLPYSEDDLGYGS